MRLVDVETQLSPVTASNNMGASSAVIIVFLIHIHPSFGVKNSTERIVNPDAKPMFAYRSHFKGLTTTYKNCFGVSPDYHGGEDKPCVFPFIYRGTVYRACTILADEFPWCATQVDKNGHLITNEWGYCTAECPLEKRARCKTVEGGPVVGAFCSFPFRYHGVEYSKCIEMENCPEPDMMTNKTLGWCATKVDAHGDFYGYDWGACQPECKPVPMSNETEILTMQPRIDDNLGGLSDLGMNPPGLNSSGVSGDNATSSQTSPTSTFMASTESSTTVSQLPTSQNPPDSTTSTTPMIGNSLSASSQTSMVSLSLANSSITSDLATSVQATTSIPNPNLSTSTNPGDALSTSTAVNGALASSSSSSAGSTPASTTPNPINTLPTSTTANGALASLSSSSAGSTPASTTPNPINTLLTSTTTANLASASSSTTPQSSTSSLPTGTSLAMNASASIATESSSSPAMNVDGSIIAATESSMIGLFESTTSSSNSLSTGSTLLVPNVSEAQTSSTTTPSSIPIVSSSSGTEASNALSTSPTPTTSGSPATIGNETLNNSGSESSTLNDTASVGLGGNEIGIFEIGDGSSLQNSSDINTNDTHTCISANPTCKSLCSTDDQPCLTPCSPEDGVPLGSAMCIKNCNLGELNTFCLDDCIPPPDKCRGPPKVAIPLSQLPIFSDSDTATYIPHAYKDPVLEILLNEGLPIAVQS